ncbi:hypothetical protein GGR50DRAFT_685279 [Xylaria sp. CBS 124048]|nr:hypothetical protein GGR50DRAFT_685279 [Xylaria sp. CBS 124048]
MAQPSYMLSPTMRSISLAKIRELEKQRDRYEARKNKVLAAVDSHPGDIRGRITELLRGVKDLCKTELSQDYRVLNVDLWLQQASYDASIPAHMLQSCEDLLRAKLDVQSRKLNIGHLWSRLVTEWMDSSTPMSGAPAADDEGPNDVDRQEQRLKELCEKFEKVVFTPLETDESRIKQYMQNLFTGDDAKKALESLRSRIQRDELALLDSQAPFNRDTLRWCVNGLLAEDLLSDEKQATLRDFLENPVVLDEISDVLNMRFADFDNWSWDASEYGIPVLPRPQLNGKYRIWMDEDVLQAIFIHYVGIKNCVGLKATLTSFLNRQDGTWAWRAGQNMSSASRIRHEYFSNMRSTSTFTVEHTRSNLFRESFFLSQLPDSVTTIGKNQAYASDGEPQEDDEKREESEKTAEKVNIKQKLLRTLATEVITHRTLYGEAAVVQSDLQWYATGLSHTTIFATMRFLGYSERMVSFYQKVLQAPLNMDSTPGATPSGAPRIRQRGVPMAHAPEKLIGEMVLFIMDLAVNKATGMLLYRLHDDLFLCGEPSRCARAWKEMAEFADVMGVEFNDNKTGSVYLTNSHENRDAEIEARLPGGVVRIGHLLLDSASGEWVLDHDQIDEHVAQLRKQLAACNSILDWVRTWNSCMGRFFSHTLGEPAFCFGLKHVDSVLQIYQRMQKVLFKSTSPSHGSDGNQPTTEDNVVDYLKSRIEERFGLSDVPDAFIFLPEKMVSDEREEYEKARKELAKLNSPELRLARLRDLYPDNLWFENGRAILDKALIPGQDDQFMSFEEYTRHRELTSDLLRKAYQRLLDSPTQTGAYLEPFVTDALLSAGIKESSNASKLLQIQWVLQLYRDELKERWGGSRLVDSKSLPLGLLAMMRRKGVHLPFIPISDSTSTSTNITTSSTQSHKPSNQPASADSPSNPLRLIPRAYRPILTTLHVLYPTSLLPALDLLDRRLVTRVVLKYEADQPLSPPKSDIISGQNITPGSKGKHVTGSTTRSEKGLFLYHLVSSAQQQSHRHHHQAASSTGQVYVVRLESWNCTCAAFAFSAFPPVSASDGYEIHPGTRPQANVSKSEKTWEFGGLSRDGKDDAGGVPCCKHLLACVLAEKWPAVLGSYMEERLVGREEGAGLVGDL